MKKTICFFLSLFFLSLSMAFAHPPSDIVIKFDPSTKMLSTVIKHPVSNPQTHYIYKVDIGLNGREIQSIPFNSQKTSSEQIVEVQLEGIKPGDVLSVEGYCNLSGKLKKEITVA